MHQKGFSRLLVLMAVVSLIIAIISYKGYITINQPNSSNETKLPFPSDTPPSPFQDSADYPSDPTTVVQNFYDWYTSCLDLHFWNATHNSNYPNINPAQACDYKKSRYVSQELIQTLTKYDRDFMNKCSDEAKAMGACSHGDLILCAQNTPEKATANTAVINKENANLTVNTFGADRLSVNLKIINNKWQITNISCLQN